MNTSKLYTQLKKIESTYHTPDGYTTLMNLIRDTEEEIRKEANKQSGSASVYKAACNILKEAQKTRHPDMLCKAHRSKETLDICDSYRLIRFNLDTAPALPEHPEGYDYIAVEKIMYGMKDNCTVELKIPELGELKAFVKTESARLTAEKAQFKTPVLKVPCLDGEIWFNAKWLVDMLECLPGCTVKAEPKRYRISGVYFEASNGCGLMLPLNQKEVQK